MDQTLLTTARVRDVVNQLEVVHLGESIGRNGLLAPHDAPAIGHRELRLFSVLLPDKTVDQRIECGIEDVENQPAAIHEVPTDRRQTRELIVDGQQMLERTKRNRREREPS